MLVCVPPVGGDFGSIPSPSLLPPLDKAPGSIFRSSISPPPSPPLTSLLLWRFLFSGPIPSAGQRRRRRRRRRRGSRWERRKKWERKCRLSIGSLLPPLSGRPRMKPWLWGETRRRRRHMPHHHHGLTTLLYLRGGEVREGGVRWTGHHHRRLPLSSVMSSLSLARKNLLDVSSAGGEFNRI